MLFVLSTENIKKFRNITLSNVITKYFPYNFRK